MDLKQNKSRFLILLLRHLKYHQRKGKLIYSPHLIDTKYDTLISLSNSPDTNRRASSHHPRFQPCESSRGYGAYLLR